MSASAWKFFNQAKKQLGEASGGIRLDSGIFRLSLHTSAAAITTTTDVSTLASIGSEITAEVLNMTRDVTELIVTFVPQPGSTIQNYHRLYAEQYNIGFNPHFYIGYDAITYRGRPLNIEASSKPRSITRRPH